MSENKAKREKQVIEASDVGDAASVLGLGGGPSSTSAEAIGEQGSGALQGPGAGPSSTTVEALGKQGSGSLQAAGGVVSTAMLPTEGVVAPQRGPQPPSVGRIVHYKLAVRDVQAIGDMRTKMMTSGNRHDEGDIVPAIIVRVWDPNGYEGAGKCNLKVFVDGDVRDLWVTSATRGDANGQWNWPPKV